jgi:hypothetical protein
MTLSIDSQHNSIGCIYAECRYAECHNYLNVMLSVVMLNVIMLRFIRLNVVKLNVGARPLPYLKDQTRMKTFESNALSF